MCHKTEKIIQEPRYPRFISNRAIGDDKLKGESQNRLASAIQKYVESTDSNLSQENCLPRIIGIEGPWGSGKTNVVRNLKKKLSGSYYVFEYDAWGHQEDLQRRSILETLTSQLIEDGVLPKEDKVTPSIVENDTLVSWPTKLEELLAHRKITDNTTVPMLNGGAIVLLFCSILIPLLRNIVDVYFNCWHSLVKACFPYFPFFLALLGWCMWSLWHKRKINLGELLKISKEGSTTTRNYETISEDEPSVMKFKKWMNDLSDYLVHSSKQNKLILVFDNMDRLQKHQVREFWASIHTFFSEGSFENIWAIIPYDFNHLKDTFDETADAELFLQKTFPVSYSVASPVVSDYKDIFYQFYLEAFGPNFLSYVDDVSRIYRLSKPSPNVRDVIIFINKLVALYQLWGECINLKSMALYALNSQKIEASPEKQILSGDFLRENNINRIIEYDTKIQTEIAALYYGITVDHAMQIPLGNYILRSIGGEDEYDINTHAENDNFDDILENVIEKEDNIRLDDIINNCLSKLVKQNQRIASVWAGVATRYCKNHIESLSLSQAAKHLLLHTKGHTRQLVVNHLFSEFQSYKEISGSQYFVAMSDLDLFLKENEISETYVDVSLNLKPKEFVAYLRQAKKEYGAYSVCCNAEDLDHYLAEELSKETYEIVDIISLLRLDTQYAFPVLKAALKTNITGKARITPHYVGENLVSYRLLCDGRVDAVIPVSECGTLEQNLRTNKITEGYVDVVASLIVHNQSTSNVSIEMIGVGSLADIVLQYMSMDDLLTYAYNHSNDRVVKDLMNYMVSNGLGEAFDVKHMSELESYKTQFSIDEKDILEYSSKFISDEALESITENNLLSIIPEGSSLYRAATLSNCALCTRINETLAVYLNAKCNGQTMSYNRSNYTTVFNHKAIGWLIDTTYLSPTPHYLEEFALTIFKGVDTEVYRLPLNEYENKILTRLNLSSVSVAIKDVVDKYCQDPSKVISPQKFLFYEKWIREYGNLEKQYDRFTHRVIETVVDNKDCLSCVIENSDFYADVINNSGVDGDALKNKIRNKLSSGKSEELEGFAAKIGINVSE